MIAIVDYQAGNLPSVQRAFKEIGYDSVITSNPSEIIKAEKVIFPGVGAAGKAMESLKKKSIDKALKQVVKQGKGLLGICLGAQIILEKSSENDTLCLGIIPGQAKKLLLKKDFKIPHMGWNQVRQEKYHPIFNNIPDQTNFYFVHSYYPAVSTENTLGTTEYGIVFPSVIIKDNVIAVQFHVEKSGFFGLKLLENFMAMEF